MNGIIPELEESLHSLKKPVICFSGGMDSTVLARNAKEYCSDFTLLFIRLPMNSQRQVDAAVSVADALDLPLRMERLGWDDLKGVETNGPDRCYHCKDAIFRKAEEVCRDAGSGTILAGDNADDLDSQRPGHRAALEHGVINPLKDAGIGRGRVRKCLDEMHLPIVIIKDTCMATRYPTGHPIGEREMRFVEDCEAAVRKVSGLRQLRVRIYGGRATVTTDISETGEMMRHLTKINYELRSRGLECDPDLEGYKGM